MLWSKRAVLLGCWAAGLGAACLGTSAPAMAQNYPERPITIIVGFPPGGGVDVVARVMAEKLTQILGKSVVVENRAGASGSLATRQVASLPPDGYTLLMNSNSILANQVVNASAGHDVERDLTPVMKAAVQTNILVAAPSLGVSTLADVVKLARTRDLDYGSPGLGSIPHLAAEQLFALLNIKPKHIPYPGAAQALTAVTGGHIQMACVTAPPAVTLVQGGALKGIAVTGARRLAALPDVPTVMESGQQNFAVDTWAGFFVPARTPQPVVDKLTGAMKQVLAMPDVQARLTTLGFESSGMVGADFGRDISAEIARWKDVAQKAGLKF